MGVNYDADVNAIGGGFGGGFGGGGAWPLWLLVFLGLGKNDGLFGGHGGGAGAGVLAGETQAKLDCLSQGQSALSAQITNAEQAERFAAVQANIDRQADVNRTAIQVVGDRVKDTQSQLADCCCEIRTGQLSLANDIAMQTNQLNVVANSNTQKILDAINQQNISALETANADLRAQLNRRETVADIVAACGCCGGSSNGFGGGNNTNTNIDINVLRALMSGGFNPGPGNSQG